MQTLEAFECEPSLGRLHCEYEIWKKHQDRGKKLGSTCNWNEFFGEFTKRKYHLFSRLINKSRARSRWSFNLAGWEKSTKLPASMSVSIWKSISLSCDHRGELWKIDYYWVASRSAAYMTKTNVRLCKRCIYGHTWFKSFMKLISADGYASQSARQPACCALAYLFDCW